MYICLEKKMGRRQKIRAREMTINYHVVGQQITAKKKKVTNNFEYKVPVYQAGGGFLWLWT